jgi:enoyl-CoA hydratase/carnithine racemase
MADAIRYEVADSIATITIDRPEKRGAMSFAILADFLSTVKRAAADDAARVVIVTGTEGSFCAGTDLADLSSIPGKQRGVRGEASDGDAWWPLVQCPKPVIGAIDGPAVGMGAEFTSQCDVRLASPRARFAWNFAKRGLVPDTGAGSWLLPRLLGYDRALQLLFSGRFMEADEALECGYVQAVVEPEQLAEAARAEAQSYLEGSPFSHRRIKQLVYQGLERDVAGHMEQHVALLKQCFASDDHAEGVASFLERRPARFTGN